MCALRKDLQNKLLRGKGGEQYSVFPLDLAIWFEVVCVYVCVCVHVLTCSGMIHLKENC